MLLLPSEIRFAYSKACDLAPHNYPTNNSTPPSTMNVEKLQASKLAPQMGEAYAAVERLRANPRNPQDVTMASFVRQTWGIGMEALMDELGMEPHVDTIQNLIDLPDASVRWLIPETIREAIRLGLRKSPIYKDVVAMEQSISGTSVKMPHWEMSDATPRYVGIAETIPLGGVSFGEKDVTTRKMGRGVKIPYEVRQYVAMSLVAIWLQDFGIKLGQGLDAALIDTLINGEQVSGSESAPVVGVETSGTVTYADYLKVWVRMARIGRTPNTIISGEDMALETLDLDEFKNRAQGTTHSELVMKTPVPQKNSYYIHGSVPDDQAIIIDPAGCVVKLNSQPLRIENDKKVSNQTEEFYATLTTGYCILFRDARVIVDKSLAFASNGFPSYMDVDAAEQVIFE